MEKGPRLNMYMFVFILFLGFLILFSSGRAIANKISSFFRLSFSQLFFSLFLSQSFFLFLSLSIIGNGKQKIMVRWQMTTKKTDFGRGIFMCAILFLTMEMSKCTPFPNVNSSILSKCTILKISHKTPHQTRTEFVGFFSLLTFGVRVFMEFLFSFAGKWVRKRRAHIWNQNK